MVRLAGAAIAVALMATAAQGQVQDPGLRSLEMSAQLAPRDGGAAIELANAYWRSGQTGQAMRAYRRALALDNVMMETRGGDAIWSHDVATRALAQQTTLAGR